MLKWQVHQARKVTFWSSVLKKGWKQLGYARCLVMNWLGRFLRSLFCFFRRVHETTMWNMLPSYVTGKYHSMVYIWSGYGRLMQRRYSVLFIISGKVYLCSFDQISQVPWKLMLPARRSTGQRKRNMHERKRNMHKHTWKSPGHCWICVSMIQI